MASAASRFHFRANAVLLFCYVLLLASCITSEGRRRIHGPERRVNEKVFNVLDFGAKPDGRKDNSLEFIRTFRAACAWKGYARVVIPAGNFFAGAVVFEGPCQGRIIFQILGTVKAFSDPSSYAEDSWILFENINGLEICGTGTVDGQGASVWKYNDGGANFPMSIKLNHITNGVIRQINSLNPMGFHVGIVLSQNIRAKRLHLTAPGDSPNTDGIHISQSSLVKIAKSVISTGDDCVGIIHGSTDVSVTRVTCGPGHGFSIGSLGKYDAEKDVRGIRVTNCTLKNTDNGIRIKTWAGSPPSQASSVFFEDIVMEDVKNPIVIDQNYGSKSKKPSKVKLSDIHYTNIRGTTVSDVAVDLQCSQAVPCEKVELANVNLKYTGARPVPLTSSCANAKVTYVGVQFPPPCKI